MPGTVVAGTDGSPSAQVAVERAVQVASLDGGDVLLVHAYDRPKGGLAAPLSGDEPIDPAVRGRILLEAARRRYEDIGLTTILRQGEPADVLTAAVTSVGARLAVVGNRGMGSVRQRLIGSIPHRLSHHQPADLLIVHSTDGRHAEALDPPAGTPPYRRIVVGVDDSETSLVALRGAADLACSADAELLLTTVQVGREPAASLDLPWALAREFGLEPKTHTAVAKSAAAGLCETAVSHDAQLIVVGNVGMSTTPRLLGGCVPDEVTHGAPCDVLVVRTS